MRRSQRVLATTCAALLIALTIVPAALAAPPLALDTGPVTDDARALGDDAAKVEEALENLNEEHGVQLFYVLVDSFDGMDSNDWAEETASINGLGLNDILIAVAIRDQQYAWSVDEDFPLSDDELNEVAADRIEPELQDSDWSAAAIAAAEGYGEALAASPDDGVGATGSGGASPLPCLLGAGLFAAIGGAIAFVLSRRKRGAVSSGTADGHGEPSMKDLETSAGKLLVEVDDALRTSEQELGFAEAEFGTDAVAEYRAALEESKREAAEAFRIQQQVYDAEPEDEATRRGMLQRIIELATAADTRLDEKADGFSKLRDMAGRADEVLASVTKRLDAVEAGIPAASETLARLKSTYLPDALGEVADDDAEATELLDTARAAIAQGAAASASGDRNAAALAARTAENATATAEQLLAAVAAAQEQLKSAQAALSDEAARLESTAAAAEAQDATRYAALVTTARSAVAAARSALASPPLDPVAHAAKIREAATQLDAALAEARDEAQRAEAARASAADAIAGARSRIAAGESFVATRAAIVGAQARSSLTEATTRLARAEQVLSADPSSALTEAQAALQYAESALRYAQGDATSHAGTSGGGGGGSTSRSAPSWPAAAPGGSFGGSSSRRSGGSSISGSSRTSSSSSSASSRSSSGRRGGGGRF